MNEAKAVYIVVIKLNVLLFTFVRVCFEYCYLPLSVSFLYLVRVFTEPFREGI